MKRFYFRKLVNLFHVNFVSIIRNGFSQGSRTQKHDMPLVSFVAPKQNISSVQIIQNAQDSITLIKLQVMKIMSFGRRKKGKMVA